MSRGDDPTKLLLLNTKLVLVLFARMCDKEVTKEVFMSNFNKEKSKKLKRLIGLRVFNALGMIAWKDTEYSYAQQYLRLAHPLSWLWVIAVALYASIMQGIPETISDMKSIINNETVWW